MQMYYVKNYRGILNGLIARSQNTSKKIEQINAIKIRVSEWLYDNVIPKQEPKSSRSNNILKFHNSKSQDNGITNLWKPYRSDSNHYSILFTDNLDG